MIKKIALSLLSLFLLFTFAGIRPQEDGVHGFSQWHTRFDFLRFCRIPISFSDRQTSWWGFHCADGIYCFPCT